MRIGFLSRYQNIVNRGVETFVLELSSRLKKRHQVEVLAGKDSDNLGKVIKRNFDVVIPLNGRFQSLKVSLGRMIGKYKMLTSGHAGVGRDEIWNIVIARPDVYVALTDCMANWAKKWAFGIEVIKIPNGVDPDKFKPDGPRMDLGLERPIILSVGALVWYKYHEKAIEAVSKLEKGSLLIVGSGELEQKLQKLGELKLPNRFKIMQLPHADMPKLYRSVDLFTLPSWDREAFGIVYLEALSTNIPVVAPDGASRREIIGDGGLLVDVDNEESYAKTLEKASQMNWGNKPRIQAEKFSWDIISKKYEEVFINLVKS